ncbi:MAG: hypothetical protein UV61_C0001G0096 [Candidatus Gottesmanbacteria bacterium GW2011_GWB1_43_11]|uniref:Uncharacterized protein n=1 Tax=Candidatus Gottesmanbacteria bacterium GW2011_GWB1_43_11 TaxID=1618446 RepID=A0A0G1CQ75_9BACT|nr:MAG: hypothetical protein UV04_C0004G0038 [Candidatus Gottesmanbacteria bacterium GW2011_GWA2_42_16]KKS56061.1 MAG: hypothetical protein UV17_C0003G0033 [Candidatus Gottesmanbacteria bacterium GW2011_GWA1_42_26]KKS81628.1 MAG: hypothetical protein UV55_C0011G0022 [Candidatus Gottesmanbacteria bacterium GW2011_GWC1_43_10]KKS87689.1 MAG: hypothetical protein UV61_C0001G0096 [Candidatus Gottesmanbacteria bacterium GW2011_GWB1_43_11]
MMLLRQIQKLYEILKKIIRSIFTGIGKAINEFIDKY